MTNTDPSKIIIKKATAFFKNHGIQRKGQSRIFHDDNYWFTTIIEFQPHSFEKGTFLNVGVNFHWYEKDYFSFDIGHRQSPFIKFDNEDQFNKEIEMLCKYALDQIVEYRKSFETLNTAHIMICKTEFASESLWGNYHKGVISGLIGDFKSIKNYFEMLLNEEHNVEWAKELKKRTKFLLENSADVESFKSEVKKLITETRKLKKLTDCKPSF